MHSDILQTWADVLKALQALAPEQLAQSPMVMPHEPDGTKTVELLPIYAMMTVADTEQQTHSNDDREHHPEQVVLMTDFHSFDSEGNSTYELTDEGYIGNKTGKVYTEEDMDNL